MVGRFTGSALAASGLGGSAARWVGQLPDTPLVLLSPVPDSFCAFV